MGSTFPGQLDSGLITADELAGWFRLVPPTESGAAQAGNATQVVDSDTAPGAEVASAPRVSRSATVDDAGGFRDPANPIQSAAMAATVRLKVEDDAGFSHATGTVIHSHGGEAIVLTCGHVFRDSGGGGTITADLGWLPGETQRTVPGHLLDYDAGPRDVALVVIQAGVELPAIPLAPRELVVSPNDAVFSVGCDRGQPPTIRPTTVKNLARYDDVVKIDIHGRPVEGRSGGGLFSAGGQLIGVCNAAAVDFDEGIYTSLDNIWHQLAQTGVDRVMRQPASGLESAPASMLADNSAPPAPVNSAHELASIQRSAPPTTPVVHQPSPAGPSGIASSGAQTELFVVVHDRATGGTRTLVISAPDSRLLDYLDQAGSRPAAGDPAADRWAALRDTMPLPAGMASEMGSLRAQSPDGRR
jgi:Trypsin-like peptidase domain